MRKVTGSDLIIKTFCWLMIFLEEWLVFIKGSTPHFMEIGSTIAILLLQKTAHENVERYTNKRCNDNEGNRNAIS